MAYRLIVQFGDQTIRVKLLAGFNVVGSDPTCEIFVPDETVSRRHLVVTLREGRVEVEDLGSVNGTFLHALRIEKAELKPGDQIEFGRASALLEELADDDLEVGIGLPVSDNPPIGKLLYSAPARSYSVADRFALDHLPHLLNRMEEGATRNQMALWVGTSLFEALPLAAVEILDAGGTESAVLFEASRPRLTSFETSLDVDQLKAGDPIALEGLIPAHQIDQRWAEVSAGLCRIRGLFQNPQALERSLSSLESSIRLIALAESLEGWRPILEKSQVSQLVRPLILNINDLLIAKISREPKLLYEIDPFRFEEFMAELFRGLGYAVEQTKRTRDGGVDVIAVKSLDEVPLRFLIECKRYAKHRKVDISVVRALLGTKSVLGASKGIIAATSSFTRPAQEFARMREWELELKDFNGIMSWVSSYMKKNQVG